jgi:hypothetical protein
MRRYVVILAATLSLAGLVTASIAGPGASSSGASSSGASSSGAGSSGASSSGASSGGGGGHVGGSSGGGGHPAGGLGSTGYAAHGDYVAHGARGGYGIVGYRSAGLGHDEAAPQSGHAARNTLTIGPPTGSAAKAMRMTDSQTAAHTPPKHPHHPHRYFPEMSAMPSPFCIPAGSAQSWNAAFTCPQPIKTKMAH